jgi:hypothetical protein
LSSFGLSLRFADERLVGAAEALMEAQHMAWPPDERPHYERLLAVLPDSMGTAEFERVRAAGGDIGTPAAIDLALGRAARGATA